VRFGLVPLTGDNQFLKYAVELGLPGLLLHLAIFAAIASAGLRVFRGTFSPTQKCFGAVTVLATLGILVNGWTASVFNSTLLAYLYFWLGGAVVTTSHRDSTI
jgi:O-antigen ligase